MAVVNDTAVSIASAGLIQNLGPDAAYVGGASVAPETGFRVSAGEAVSVGLATNTLYVVSDGTSDIRILSRGIGIFSITLPAE